MMRRHEEMPGKGGMALRGHDLVITFWAAEIRGRDEPEFEAVALAVMAGTAVSQHFGEMYDGKPLYNDRLSPRDYQAYFAFLNSFGDQATRAQALLVGPSYLAAISLMRHLSTDREFTVPPAYRLKKPAMPNASLERIARYWSEYAQKRALAMADGQPKEGPR